MADKTYNSLSDAMKVSTDLQNKTGMIHYIGEDKKGKYYIQPVNQKVGTSKPIKYKSGGKIKKVY